MSYNLLPNLVKRRRLHKILSGRAYYQLYDDRYKDLHAVGASTSDQEGARARRELVHKEIEALCESGHVLRPPARVLDVGCGEGDNAVNLAQLGYTVTGVDISPEAIKVGSKRANELRVAIDFRVGNALDLAELQNETFDLVFDVGCLHMLVRAADRRQHLREARRVLRPGGALYLFEHVSAKDVKIADEEAHLLRSAGVVHIRWLPERRVLLSTIGCGHRSASLRQYCTELSAAGFEVVIARRHDDFTFCTLLARVAEQSVATSDGLAAPSDKT